MVGRASSTESQENKKTKKSIAEGNYEGNYDGSGDSEGLGVVNYQDFVSDKEFLLESGAILSGFTVRYETYGELNETCDNAVLIIHALTGNHHAAGYYANSEGKIEKSSRGWWDDMIGPGKAFDTNKYFVVCSNNLGGCSGTTGPNSINPKTDKPYATDFPIITISDMALVQLELMEHLGIKRFHSMAGGSMGGLLALHWSIHYPELVERVIAIATTASQNAQSIAFSEVARQAIMKDPNWNNGNYVYEADNKGPANGLAVARMLAHITYLSDESLRSKFGRELQDKEKLDFTFDAEFKVESYLRYKGAKFIDRFDANSYIYITKALNYADLSRGFSSLKEAFLKAQAKYLVLTFSSDWLYPPYMGEQLVEAILQAGKEGSYAEIETGAGHDAFLLEWRRTTELVKNFFQDE